MKDNYYTTYGIKVAGTGLKGRVGTRPAPVVWHTRRILWRFARIYCWVELCEALLECQAVKDGLSVELRDEEYEALFETLDDSVEWRHIICVDCVMRVLEMVRRWLSALANEDAIGAQTWEPIKWLLVRLRALCKTMPHVRELIADFDSHTESFFNQLYRADPALRKPLIYFSALWSFSTARKVVAAAELESLRKLYSQSREGQDRAAELNCWIAILSKARAETKMSRSVCPTAMKEFELKEAAAQSANGVMTDEGPEDLTLQIFLHTHFALHLYTRLFAFLIQGADAQRKVWRLETAMERKTESPPVKQLKTEKVDTFDETFEDASVPNAPIPFGNIILLEAGITGRHCRILQHIQEGGLEMSFRAHLGYDDEFDEGGGANMAYDVTRLKECLDDLEYLQEEAVTYIQQTRTDAQSIAVAIYGRVCSYAAFLDYSMNMLTHVIIPLSTNTPIAWHHIKLTPCLHQLYDRRTVSSIAHALYTSPTHCAGVWFTLLYLTCLSNFRAGRREARSLLQDILNKRWTPSTPETAPLILLVLSHQAADARELFSLITLLSTYTTRHQLFKRGATTSLKPSPSEEARLVTCLVDLSIRKVRERLMLTDILPDTRWLEVFREYWSCIRTSQERCSALRDAVTLGLQVLAGG
eukprot:Blabericola_migrator_1__2489@NODE_16_length_23467_cov_90_205256_g13_i0_p4_GENE_NODE_16_length_23467_cov_90_205256_g13_i0NODE_16_length_23467_cov_90_205256_g13_i0_p4_ORF_typecomplete_len644_score105_77_NODE_16_length_23467_cov_90_205256_g13_i01569417625